MLEFPEVTALAGQLNGHVAGRAVLRTLPPTKAHKFCWYNGDPADYDERIRGARVQGAEGFGIFVELGFSNGYKLCFNDGVNARLWGPGEAPRAYQLMLALEDGGALAFTVAMYGSLILHDGSYDNPYYCKSKAALSPLSPDFPAYFRRTLAAGKPALSLKAFLATEQRFPGIGNGVLQDILLAARLHPKRKLGSLTGAEREKLLQSAVQTLGEMAAQGGRNTEKGLFGKPGGYPVRLSKNTRSCPLCGGEVVKEAYLGGSVYYCPACQPLEPPH